MPLPREVSDWIARAEIDYLGPFVSAWAAFNAWYRHASGSAKDSDGLFYVRSRQNSVRSAILPYLDPLTEDTPEAAAFKQQLAALHGALEAHRLETTHKDKVEHVSFRSVPIGQGRQLPQMSNPSGMSYRVDKVNGRWVCTVANRQAVETCRVELAEFDITALETHPAYGGLSRAAKANLRALFLDCNPRPMINLLNGDNRPIQAGTIAFRCSPDDLFSGTVMTIYRMRNLLLHGELSPHEASLACYGPAYRVIRAMLRHCA